LSSGKRKDQGLVQHREYQQGLTAGCQDDCDWNKPGETEITGKASGMHYHKYVGMKIKQN
jgi:hypothetical protein